MRKFILVFLITVIGFSLYGISNESLIKSSLFENYTVSNGLSDEKIHCVFQDSRGWIWLGTDYGIFRFDGYNFTSFDIQSKESKILSNSLIRKIFEDSLGNIWIGTDFQGLFRYNRNENILSQFKNNGLSHNSVWEIIQDSKGNLWLGTEGGLNYFNPQTQQIEQTITTGNSNLIQGNWIRKILIDQEDNLWVGTNKGIAVLNKDLELQNSYLSNVEFKERENEIWEIYEDNVGDIWIGTYLGGLLKYNRNTNIFSTIFLDKNNPRSITVRSIIQDARGDYWFGTRGGLYSLNNFTQTIHLFNHERDNEYSLIHNSVLNLFTDKKGDLWVGTRNGLSYLNFDKQAFGYLSDYMGETNKLNDGEVYVIWENEDDSFWIGTESGGINIFNEERNTITFLNQDNGLSSNCIKAICSDNYGNVLIGTYLGGLNIYNPETGKVKILMHNINDSLSISDNEVWSIIKDSKNRIWIGTSKGLDLFNEKSQTFKHYAKEYNLDWVSMIYEDGNRNLWVYSPDIDIMTLIKPDKTLKTFNIQSRALCEDIDGNVWLATLGMGLLKYSPLGEELERFTTEDGLCNNILNGIVNVNNEYLWISSNNGISRFNIENKEFNNYYSSDGLLNDKFNYGAFCKTSSNVLAFGGKKGVDFVYLDKINKNDYIPPIVITNFKIYNENIDAKTNGILSKDISETDIIKLNHKQNMISFNFAALNYANSDKNKYKYKLEGFDQNWNNIGTSRTATYTNLDHGDFVFKVVGSNNDYVYNEEGVNLTVIISPPTWKTWWFRTSAIFVLIILFYFIYRMIRNREILKQELIYERQTARKLQDIDRLKHQFFMNVSHEIRTPLSLIIGPIDKLLSLNYENDIIFKNLQIIKRNTTNLKKLVNQLLDYRKLETGNLKLDMRKGNLRSFIEEIIESFKNSAEQKDIKLTFKAFQPSIFIWFDADKVEKIVNNLISNAIKYTLEKGHVSISMSLVFIDDIEESNLFIPPLDIDNTTYKKFVKLKVVDSGIGIAEEDLPKIFDRFRRIKQIGQKPIQGSGIGLALTKELVKIHNGHLKVRSKVGKGSRFSVYLPFEDRSVKEHRGDNPLSIEKEELLQTENNEKTSQLIALLVDDNPDLREFIRTHFEPEYLIFEGKNGKEAWELALEKIPDVVIADVMMPVMDGNELCKKLKRDERTSHIPVIMLSALGTNENQLAGIDAGADDYLTKPFDVGLLKAKVDNLLSVRKALRERYSKELVLKPKDIILASPDEKFLKRLIGLIEKHIASDSLDVDFLAQNMDISRTQLYRKIAALTDMTPKEFVRDLRLKRAAQLLNQKKLNISEVAYDIGFNDVSYFRKCFKEKFGMSASEYIQSKFNFNN